MRTNRSPLAASMLAPMLAAVLAVGGCYAPDGGFMPASGRGFTYISTPFKPLTVTLVDVRTEEPFFVMAIPPGQQLTFKFLEGKGDDEIWTPDLMEWELFDEPSSMGGLGNAMTVPPANCRRIDLSLRPAPENPPVPDNEQLEIVDPMVAPWWTPEGGPKPQRKVRIYD
jgi:rhodanese-related sulfurtransferase